LIDGGLNLNPGIGIAGAFVVGYSLLSTLRKVVIFSRSWWTKKADQWFVRLTFFWQPGCGHDMGRRFHNDRYPRYSIKNWVGSIGRGIRSSYRRRIRARQKDELRRNPDNSATAEEYKFMPISRSY
jgi:hypothetical protein